MDAIGDYYDKSNSQDPTYVISIGIYLYVLIHRNFKGNRTFFPVLKEETESGEY